MEEDILQMARYWASQSKAIKKTHRKTQRHPAMIITDIKQLRDLTVGEIAVLVMQFEVVKADGNDGNPCEFCIFDGSVCSTCGRKDRPDGESIKYIKI